MFLLIEFLSDCVTTQASVMRNCRRRTRLDPTCSSLTKASMKKKNMTTAIILMMTMKGMSNIREQKMMDRMLKKQAVLVMLSLRAVLKMMQRQKQRKKRTSLDNWMTRIMKESCLLKKK